MLEQVAKDMDIIDIMATIGKNAKAACPPLATATSGQKNAALKAMAQAINASTDVILAANAIDMKNALATGMSSSFLDRLKLNAERVAAMADGLLAVAALDDPIGTIIARWERPNGLQIERVRTPLGAIGVIYESRPNVTADAGALCLKAGNAVVLRGGSDSINSSGAIHACLVEGLEKAGLPKTAIQMVPVSDRRAVGEMLTGLNGSIDVIIPRGGRGLVERVQREARVPVFAHLEGLCHLYIDRSAQLEMAKAIAVNAKMRRTGICGSVETLLVDKAAAKTHLGAVLDALKIAGCEIRGSEAVRKIYSDCKPATEEDWTTEYLDSIISVDLVDGVDGAIAHIGHYSSNHTEAIVTEDAAAVEAFMNEIDSAILLHNASTQYADGGEFGMGAEIGIATGKMHARGPVGVEQLTSFKYKVRGTGQIRP